jgi:hypothetical protein
LAVTDQNSRFWNEFVNAISDGFDGLDAVMQEVDLSAPSQFPLDGIADDAFVVRAKKGFDWDAVCRRFPKLPCGRQYPKFCVWIGFTRFHFLESAS